ncbi:50S ribosomal protein L4 [Candidatus Magnetaquicoccus inordinatus]|uniref:50S ribosomal protein L4 n=1 Tax=Candidatus Magnetaquicoccus inordinatus TaxID=2496818 RepID=UPI00102C01FA|nr:50S ribosomal protein L4 [Candidatus Magnetaquicoccus inordinatus]
MIEIPVVDAGNQELRRVEVEEAIFAREIRTDIVARMVNYQLAGRRGGNASTKRRSEVSGGGKKPYRQKGTGNARQGTARAPQFRTGGIVFGPQPHSYAQKLPKKVRRMALQIALTAKLQAGELVIVEDFGLTEIKTKAAKAVMQNLGIGRSGLVVLSESNQIVELSIRNLPGIDVMRVEGVNVYDLLAHEKVIMTAEALNRLQERLA